jgi:uncharacterized protein (DUF779 family)
MINLFKNLEVRNLQAGNIDTSGNIINSVSGNVTFAQRPFVNGVGVLLSGEISPSPSGVVYLTGNQNISGTKNFYTRPTVNGTGVLLIGESGAVSFENIVYQIGNQPISGVKTFYSTGYFLSGLIISGSGLKVSGAASFSQRPFVNGTGVLLSGEAAPLPNTIVYTTGDQVINGIKQFYSDVNFYQSAIFGGGSAPLVINLDGYILNDVNLAINVPGRTLADLNENQNISWAGTNYTLDVYGTIGNSAGSLTIQGGEGAYTYGGTIQALSSSTAVGGGVSLNGAFGNNNDGGGSILVQGGQSTLSTYGDGGSIIITPGNSGPGNGGNGGNIILNIGAGDGVGKNGSVGINNNNPQYTLDVSGSGNFRSGLYVNGIAVSTGIATGNFITTGQTGSFYPSSNPSGFITTGQTGQFASVANLQSTGSNLQGQINSLSGTVTGNYVLKSQTGVFVPTGQTGQFASAANLISTGSNLQGQINSLSGTITGNYILTTTATGISGVLASSIASTGSNLQGQINSLSGSLTGNYLLKSSTGIFVTTGQTGNFITTSQTGQFYPASNPSGYITGFNSGLYVQTGQTGNFVTTSQTGNANTLNGQSGSYYLNYANMTGSIAGTGSFVTTSQTGSFITSGQTGVFVTTGQTGQFYLSNNPSGFITGFNSGLYVQTGQTGSFITTGQTGSFITTSQTGIFGNATGLNGFSGPYYLNYGNMTGSIVGTGSFITNGQTGIFITTGQTGNFATSVNLASTGSNLQGQISSLSGTLTGNYATSGFGASTYATITNLASTGSNLQGQISSLSGTLTGNYVLTSTATGISGILTTSIASTGFNLQGQINSLSGKVIYTTGSQQTISGVGINSILSVLAPSGLTGDYYNALDSGRNSVFRVGPITNGTRLAIFPSGNPTTWGKLSIEPDPAYAAGWATFLGVSTNGNGGRIYLCGLDTNGAPTQGFTALNLSYVKTVESFPSKLSMQANDNGLGYNSASVSAIAGGVGDLVLAVGSAGGFITNAQINTNNTASLSFKSYNNTGQQYVAQHPEAYTFDTAYDVPSLGSLQHTRWKVSGSNIMSLNPSGRLGIRTDSPNYQLEVIGSGNFSSGLFVSGVSVSTGINTNSFVTTGQTGVFATSANLISTGSNLQGQISSLSGLFSTGNQTGILSISGTKTFTGIVNFNSATFVNRPTVNGTGVLLSGEASAATVSNVVYTTGNTTQTISGSLTVTGHFSANTKSFLINHPTQVGRKLQYGVIEGPEHSVYIRGKLTGNDFISFPNYWSGLVDLNSVTVSLTPIGYSQNLYVNDVNISGVKIYSDAPVPNCYYHIFAERKDVPKLDVEI